MKETDNNDVVDLVNEDFELKIPQDYLSEAQLLEALSQHVEYMLERKTEILMSTLYRLDVSEKKVAKAMMPDSVLPPHIGIAQLIIERQKQRVQTKQMQQPKIGEDWFDF